MKSAAIIFLSALTVMSCKKKDDETTPVTTASTFNNVSYGASSQQKMDIYLPANRSAATTKTFVVIHGGAWSGGDKADMVASVNELKNRFPDYAFVNLNYRLAASGNTNLFPSQEEDVEAAIAYYLSRAEEFNVSGDLVLFGYSAGAHLSLLHAYKNDPGHHVKAVVDAFGPTDLPAMYNLNSTNQLALYFVTGFTFAQNPTIYNESSPIQYVSAQTPPTIVLQGGADTVVDPTQSTSLITALSQAGIINQYVYYENEGHGWGGLNLLDSFNKVEAFVKANVD